VDLYRAVRRHPAVELAITLAVAIVVALAVQAWIVKPYRIPSGSMLETFQLRDRVIAARFLYHFTDPERGDILVFNPNGRGDDVFASDTAADVVYVKRLIAMDGEWVQAREGRVQVCAEKARRCRTLEEPYVSSTQLDFDPVRVPPGEYFMMGDNRAASDDSRSWGTISRDQVIGRAFMIYWPLKRISFF
jgi:signal peptidase I